MLLFFRLNQTMALNFGLFAVLVGIVLPGVISIPHFVSHPKSQFLMERERLILNCSTSWHAKVVSFFNMTSPETGISINWLLNGSRMDSDESTDQISLFSISQSSPNESVLVLERFKRSYEGVDQCRANFGTSSLLSWSASVSIACEHTCCKYAMVNSINHRAMS